MADADYEPPSKVAREDEEDIIVNVVDDDLCELYRRSGVSFIEFSKNKDFMDAPPADIKLFLERDDLMADTEEDIYFALERWYKLDKKSRLRGFVAALQSIRYALLSHHAVIPVTDAIFNACARKWTKDLREEISNYWQGFERNRVYSKLNNPKPRISYAEVKNYLYVLGAPKDGSQFLQCYDFGSKSWDVVKEKIPIARTEAGVAAFEGRVWVAGGLSADTELRPLDSVYSYDPVAQTWKVEANLKEKRYGLGLAALDDKLHAVGGANQEAALDTTEVYQQSVWTAGASLIEKRYDVQVVSAHGKLFAAFGTDPAQISYHRRTWEKLKSGLTERWEYCPTDFVVARRRCRLVVTRNIMYIVGGDRPETERCSMTEYHCILNCRSTRRPVFEPVRTGFAAAALGGFIYLVGGLTTDGEVVKSFQRFDPGHGKTEDLDDPPIAPGDNVRAVIIKQTILPESRPGPSRT